MVVNKHTGAIEDWWFGGGSDLTPIYINVCDSIHFHKTLKDACDLHDPSYYPKYKDVWDKYFYITYRKESRGIGGIFFENLNDRAFEDIFEFVKSVSQAFVQSYCPLVKKHKNDPYTEDNVEFRKWRRARYAEFNLVYDRGTKFGLHTPNANIENILMSLPLSWSWKFNYELKNKKEKEIMHVLKNPKDWVNHPAAQISRTLSLRTRASISYPILLLPQEELKEYWWKIQKN